MESKLKIKEKRGLYYSIDALLAGMLLIGAVMLLLNTPFYEKKTEQKSFFSQDGMNILSELKLSEVKSETIQQDIASGVLDEHRSVIEQIGEYWALNETTKAQALFNATLDTSLIGNKKILFAVENDNIYATGNPSAEDLSVSKRMIAGINKGSPITGTSASAYLTKVRDKKTASYSYFGGFIGQGNISTNIYLPSDFSQYKHISSELKAEIPGDFYIYINTIQCGNLRTGTLGTVKVWSISSCNSSFVPGVNNVSLIFDAQINQSYVSGGYLKVVYTTDTLTENITLNHKRYEFPEIDGMINIYDALSAQGVVTEWILNITFYNEYDTFMTLGNETIFYANGQNITQNIIVTRTGQLFSSTIPLRLGVTNLSNITVLTAGVPADSILVTDESGSMDDCTQNLTTNVTHCSYEGRSSTVYNVSYCAYEVRIGSTWTLINCTYSGTRCRSNYDPCNTGYSNRRNWNYYNVSTPTPWNNVDCVYSGTQCQSNYDPCSSSYTYRQNWNLYNQTVIVCNESSRKLALAKDADKLFVSIILNQSTMHRIGLVSFSNDVDSTLSLTNIATTLNNEIDTYTAGGSTCACCGINRARTMVNTSTNKKFIIFLSDGDANEYCSSYTDYTGSSNTVLARTWAINSAHYACSQNITVYTIGFGNALTASGQSVLKNMSCNSTSTGTFYFNATNVSQLAEIYRNISNQILLAANFSAQTLSILGNYSNSKILPGSYIDMSYTPFLTGNQQGKISLAFESEQFNSCNATINIPSNIVISDAYITSFSGDHWSKKLTVNDNKAYDLTNYGSDFMLLGDPFQIQVPSEFVIPGTNNNFSLLVGDSPSNTTSCSNNNSFIYTGLINASTERTDTLEYAVGCNWLIESQNGAFYSLTIPSTYSGLNNCNYTSANITFKTNDAYDSAMYALLHQLDPDNSGAIIVDLEESDLDITLTTIGGIPYLWGPSVARLEVWQ